MSLASGSVEHSRDSAVCGFFVAGAIFGAGVAAGAGVAGVAVCANAELIRKRDAKAAIVAREDIFIMGAPRGEEGATLRWHAEPPLNGDAWEHSSCDDISSQRL